MCYPVFFEMYKNAIKNTWTVEEVDFSNDIVDLQRKLTSAEKFLIHRLVAFFATGDSIVGNNLVINLYKHINSPEARLYLSRQLYEEALHVEFYLTLLDSYIPDHAEREKARRHPQYPFHSRQSAVQLQVDGFDSGIEVARDRGRPPPLLDESDLLRRHD